MYDILWKGRQQLRIENIDVPLYGFPYGFTVFLDF